MTDMRATYPFCRSESGLKGPGFGRLPLDVRPQDAPAASRLQAPDFWYSEPLP